MGSIGGCRFENRTARMNENPVKTKAARVALGVGATRMAAIKRAMGLTGRWVIVSKVRKFLADNPNFSEREVYKRKPHKPHSMAAAQSSKSSG